MTTTELSQLNTWVLSLSFVLSLLLGVLSQRTQFCTMGAISDAMVMGDWTRLRQWVLAMVVALLGFTALVATGELNPAHTLYGGVRWSWLSAALGGFLFGFGMVIASGCGARLLVRAGAGNLKSWLTLLVMAVAALATIRGITAVLRVGSVDRVYLESSESLTLPRLIATWTQSDITTVTVGTALVVAAVLATWVFSEPSIRRGRVSWVGIGVGLIVTAMWWTSGVLGHVLEHPETLEEVYLATNSGRIEALSFVGPVGYLLDWVLFYSDKNKVLTLGIVSVAGVVAGSWISAVAGRTFRWEGFRDVSDLGHHIVGAVLMGVGGVTALGCTFGQGLSGLSTLSLGSLTALCAIFLGAVIGIRYQSWRLDRS